MQHRTRRVDELPTRADAARGVAAVSSLLAHRYLPENSHVVVGALAGGVLGAVWMEKKK